MCITNCAAAWINLIRIFCPNSAEVKQLISEKRKRERERKKKSPSAQISKGFRQCLATLLHFLIYALLSLTIRGYNATRARAHKAAFVSQTVGAEEDNFLIRMGILIFSLLYLLYGKANYGARVVTARYICLWSELMQFILKCELEKANSIYIHIPGIARTKFSHIYVEWTRS